MLFGPTYLYIKQHTKTGKLYFGKTISTPEKYIGSGTLWNYHIKKHGKEHVINLWYQLYDNIFDLVADALSMSKSFDIVNNSSWLNLCIERGLDAGPIMFGEKNPMFGNTHSKEAINKIKKANVGIMNHQFGKRGELSVNFGRKANPETKLHFSNIRVYRYDVMHNNILLKNLTLKELSNLFCISFETMKKKFKLGKSYKGLSVVSRYRLLDMV